MVTFLTPSATLAALVALLPLAAAAYGLGRVARARRALGLRPPARTRLLRSAAAAAGIALLGLAAGQPALIHESKARVRRDVAALFVLDTSRSMAAAPGPREPTRLDRAVAAAVRLRAAIPEVPSGIASLTDRVIPDLLPVGGLAGFDTVAERAVAIESPPPRSAAVRATSYAALSEIATGGYFPPGTSRRLVVLLTDGESRPFDQSAVAHALAAGRGYRLLSIRFWRNDEAVYSADGAPEPGYRPDPLGRVLMAQLAAATGGRAYDERQLGTAVTGLRSLAGNGPTTSARGLTRTRRPLAPYVAVLAFALLLVALAPFGRGRRTVQSLI